MSQLNNSQSNDKGNKKGVLETIKGWLSKIPNGQEMQKKWDKEASHQDSTYAGGFGIPAPIDENSKPTEEEEKRDKEIALGAALVILSPLLIEALGVVLASEGIALYKYRAILMAFSLDRLVLSFKILLIVCN